MKKILIALTVFLFATGALCTAQQITRFAVVDTSVVYGAYFRESSAIKNYEAKKTEFQDEINRLTSEVKALQVKKADAQKSGDSSSVLRYETEITQKAAYLSEYTKAKNIQLNDMKNRLETSDDFYKLLYAEIERIAESDGYSMVLSLQQANSVLWFSPSVDITDKVIESLAAKR